MAGFQGVGYDKGRPVAVQALWFAVSRVIVMAWWCPAKIRVLILRAFGAEIGRNVLIRHGVRVHWPWKLSIGDNTWVGEGAWILNLEPVTIGANCCLSQEALICTGSHDRRSRTLEFDNAPIVLGDSVWIAARAMLLRGVTVGAGSTVAAGAIVFKDLEPGSLVKSPQSDVYSPTGKPENSM
ncbi:acetyltransferase [Gordonia sp. 852002-51296_SCH5728562-b]|nr:acetyltransferase [Gordonia sp. 852002-51296_SCH5728562-b]